MAIEVQLEFSQFPKDYTCDGKDKSPKLVLKNLPPETKTLAIIVDDPDAPIGIFTHWVIWNITPTDEIPENLPKEKEFSSPIAARQGVNDFRRIGYNGPCPPRGKPHRYYFKVYALDTSLDLKPGASKKDLEKAMEGHILDQGEAMATYQRK